MSWVKEIDLASAHEKKWREDVEITPEMLKAGVAVLMSYNPDEDGLNETVRDILSVVLSLARKPVS